MGTLSIFVSFVLFLLAALTFSFDIDGLADNVGELTAWGLTFFALGHFFAGGGVAYLRSRLND